MYLLKSIFQEGLVLARQIEDSEQMCVLLINLGAIEGLARKLC